MSSSILLFLITLPFIPGLGTDTVAEDIGTHQLERLLELLTPGECEDLLSALSRPEESIFLQLDRLNLENNPLMHQPRTRRDTDREMLCYLALTEWLQTHGKHVYYDRLSRCLQQIGRTDIAIEVGKNINQDKILGIHRYVENYHQQVEKMSSPQAKLNKEEDHQGHVPSYSMRKVRDLTRSDLDLVVERQSMPSYPHSVFDWAWPLLYGILLGLISTFLMGVSFLFIVMRVTCSSRQSRLQIFRRPKTKTHQHHRLKHTLSVL